MKKKDYRKISIEHFTRQVNVNVITETNDFIVSKSPTTLHEHSLNFEYPLIIEGIAFVFCVKGTASIRLNLTEHSIDQNSIVIVVPGNIIQVLKQSPDVRIEFLFFTPDFISNMRLTTQLGHIIKAVQGQACQKLNNEDFRELLTMHKLIIKQYQKTIVYREDVIRNLLYALIYQILQLYALYPGTQGGKAASRQQDIFIRFMGLLFEFYKNERSVQFYANKLFLTPKHFSKVIRAVNGKSVSEWIDEMVIMAAKALLKNTDITVAQIADELNFANPSFFSAYFKKRTGMTPVAYREN
ncbi:MAG: helix-turn-helix domain-containing protein [Candidatus Pseudobacter hemicellulosilyticus]|uniref:Helix-turn-helix domain-containing protein n=1 Tax=Candidatus Pseudobacter hemicellulosilyticus TaxID=3121375 RepID=A0AAJ5WVF9_9BACT|nr:MAG: helix-turn-helix domain-containing protein [Pseudobacter sp.]